MLSSSMCLENEGGGDMLSSLDGGVVGLASLAGWPPAPTLEVSPRARNCWWSKLGRNGFEGITCILTCVVLVLLVLIHTICNKKCWVTLCFYWAEVISWCDGRFNVRRDVGAKYWSSGELRTCAWSLRACQDISHVFKRNCWHSQISGVCWSQFPVGS